MSLYSASEAAMKLITSEFHTGQSGTLLIMAALCRPRLLMRVSLQRRNPSCMSGLNSSNTDLGGVYSVTGRRNRRDIQCGDDKVAFDLAPP